MMTPDQVRAAVKARGTKFATVVFQKKDGSLRTINGHFRATCHMAGGDRGAAQSEVLKANDLVAIYSLKDKGWRSFRVDAVQEIR